jgi:hypothetical protein
VIAAFTRVLIGADRKDLAGLLAIIEDRRLISRAVGAHRHDLLALGHVALAGLNKFEVPRRRSRVALAEFVAYDEAEFGDMPDHWHITFLAFVCVMRLALLGHDLRRVDVERVRCAIFARQQAAKNAAVHTLQTRQAAAFLPAHAPQPIARGVAARHFLELKKRAQPFVVTQNPQVLQRPPAAGQHQNQRQDMSRRVVTRHAAGAGQFMIDQAANAHCSNIFANQRQPAMRGQCFVRRRQLER